MATEGWTMQLGVRPGCLVCGDERDVRMGLMRYSQADENGHHYATGWHCRARLECRDRWYADNPGKAYPLDESRSPIQFTGQDPA